MPRPSNTRQIEAITELATGVARCQLSSTIINADPRVLRALAQVVALFPQPMVEGNPRLRELVALVRDIAGQPAGTSP